MASTDERDHSSMHSKNQRFEQKKLESPSHSCFLQDDVQATKWLNDKGVREAIHANPVHISGSVRFLKMV